MKELNVSSTCPSMEAQTGFLINGNAGGRNVGFGTKWRARNVFCAFPMINRETQLRSDFVVNIAVLL